MPVSEDEEESSSWEWKKGEDEKSKSHYFLIFTLVKLGGGAALSVWRQLTKGQQLKHIIEFKTIEVTLILTLSICEQNKNRTFELCSECLVLVDVLLEYYNLLQNAYIATYHISK